MGEPVPALLQRAIDVGDAAEVLVNDPDVSGTIATSVARMVSLLLGEASSSGSSTHVLQSAMNVADTAGKVIAAKRQNSDNLMALNQALKADIEQFREALAEELANPVHPSPRKRRSKKPCTDFNKYKFPYLENETIKYKNPKDKKELEQKLNDIYVVEFDKVKLIRSYKELYAQSHKEENKLIDDTCDNKELFNKNLHELYIIDKQHFRRYDGELQNYLKQYLKNKVLKKLYDENRKLS